MGRRTWGVVFKDVDGFEKTLHEPWWTHDEAKNVRAALRMLGVVAHLMELDVDTEGESKHGRQADDHD